ncbi:GDP-mannose 4,6 dehydratase [Striga asiatica]|uniref:GDP-mannose 4,6 dehydratase n=1 Tax=Striga asiatica TaxID=4170 RepID=A0A5A7QSH6_STRAF|nr:GDP-mannose 4,6 dehydratase [Striga asiatica]
MLDHPRRPSLKVWRPHPFSGDWRSISTAVDPSLPHPFLTVVSPGDNNRRISRCTTAVERGGTVEAIVEELTLRPPEDLTLSGDHLSDDLLSAADMMALAVTAKVKLDWLVAAPDRSGVRSGGRECHRGARRDRFSSGDDNSGDGTGREDGGGELKLRRG